MIKAATLSDPDSVGLRLPEDFRFERRVAKQKRLVVLSLFGQAGFLHGKAAETRHFLDLEVAKALDLKLE
jgi:hypothetical protein